MTGLDEQLRQLTAETCKHSPTSVERRQGFTQIIRLIQKSGKLWHESTLDYEDAWQNTMTFLYLNLCEATTAAQYDPARASIITWLNVYLKGRLKDYYRKQQQRQYRYISIDIPLFENINLIDTLEAPADIPPMLEEVRHWAQTDATGELANTHIRGRPDITCQLLILSRLPPETQWQELARELGVPLSTLNNFYERKCRKILRNFARSQGYLE
jgi:DNA-directed RNA polymerase specialized sigma24 family protein